ncbi:diacylglycerol kinase [Streptomyces sp. NBC_01304]|uniref:diacylglycerol kinase n=1 Tax=Streptomyces sp. NBC_01304 TaxID=2903818 RepID=UPI002E11388E|nr:diacylglycerol kinase [Streptomyces sp. NBC_01304]
MVIDPSARRSDGESVRIAKDVLCAGAAVRVCLPEGPEEFARALARRGSRRPVVVGDDRALLRAVSALHRERDLGTSVLSFVPVGPSSALAQRFGVPAGAVAAARTVLDGAPRRLDLLVDDSDGVVLGGLRIPALPQAAPVAAERPSGEAWWGAPLRTCQSLVRTLVRPAVSDAAPGPRPARLRVEADGVTLVDLDQVVEAVSVTAVRGGFARVEVRPSSVGADVAPLQARARTVTVSGPDFRYRADAVTGGPVRTRTWTVRSGAWALTLPRG